MFRKKKHIEVINLYSDQQRYTILRKDAILSLSLLPEDARWSKPSPASLPWTGSHQEIRPLCIPSCYYRSILWCHSLCWRAPGCFIPFRVCRALKLKPLCLRVPNCLSILCVCFSVSAQRCPIKAQLPLLFWELAVGPLCADPPAKCWLPCWVWKQSFAQLNAVWLPRSQLLFCSYIAGVLCFR